MKVASSTSLSIGRYNTSTQSTTKIATKTIDGESVLAFDGLSFAAKFRETKLVSCMTIFTSACGSFWCTRETTEMRSCFYAIVYTGTLPVSLLNKAIATV